MDETKKVVECHPEGVALRATTEGSLLVASEMLRGVYPEPVEGLSMT